MHCPTGTARSSDTGPRATRPPFTCSCISDGRHRRCSGRSRSTGRVMFPPAWWGYSHRAARPRHRRPPRPRRRAAGRHHPMDTPDARCSSRPRHGACHGTGRRKRSPRAAYGRLWDSRGSAAAPRRSPGPPRPCARPPRRHPPVQRCRHRCCRWETTVRRCETTVRRIDHLIDPWAIAPVSP